MKGLRLLLGIVFLGLAIFMVIGLSLPSEWQATAQSDIHAPSEFVFPYINRLSDWQRWAVWFDHDPEMEIQFAGPAEGEGASYTWKGNPSVGDGLVRIQQVDPGHRVTMVLNMDDGRFVADGSFQLAQTGEVTSVTWELHGSSGHDPFARYNRGPLERAVSRTLQDSLEKMKRVLEADFATPATAP